MAFIMLVPFAWMVLTALKTNQESISVNPFYIFPHNGWHWENFGTVWKSYNFIRSIFSRTMAGTGRISEPYGKAITLLSFIRTRS